MTADHVSQLKAFLLENGFSLNENGYAAPLGAYVTFEPGGQIEYSSPPMVAEEDAVFQKTLAFGHRRLTVIDLSFRSHQPMVDHELGLTIVFNGTIYNYPALREELNDLGSR